jgi:hypothetical protein
MAARDIDNYLARLDETKRSTLQQLRQHIRDALPDVEECISYGMPALKVDGKTRRRCQAILRRRSRPLGAAVWQLSIVGMAVPLTGPSGNA